jgi:hypothetical protein
MRKLIVAFLVVTVIFTECLLTAGPVDKKTAEKVAFNFLKNTDSRVVTPSMLSLVYSRKDEFYVFSHENGFVIVAADDTSGPILGYSKESKFRPPQNESDTLPGNNFWGILGSYGSQIRYGKAKNIPAHARISSRCYAFENDIQTKSVSASAEAVEPLLTTTWGQGWPYKALCPADPSGPGGHVWVGCVPTAFA